MYVRILLSFHPTRHVFLLLFPSAGVPSSLLSTPLLDLWPTDEEGRRVSCDLRRKRKKSFSLRLRGSITNTQGRSNNGPKGERREMYLGFTEKPSFCITKCYVLFLSPFSAWLMRPPPTFCGAAPSSCLGRRGTLAASSAGRPRRTPGWPRGPANSKFRLHATDWLENLNLIILNFNFDAYNDLAFDVLLFFSPALALRPPAPRPAAAAAGAMCCCGCGETF